ncbi:MAG: signal peptidase II [Acidobacteriota bacterium]
MLSRHYKSMKKNALYFLIISVAFLLDQITKILIQNSLTMYETRVIIKGLLNFTYVLNRGTIFGFFSNATHGATRLITFLSIIAIGFVIYIFIKTPLEQKTIKVALSLILGGAFGNLWNRIFNLWVIDFIDLHYKKFHWPTFNLADTFITIGAFIIVLDILYIKRKKTRRTDCTLS